MGEPREVDPMTYAAMKRQEQYEAMARRAADNVIAGLPAPTHTQTLIADECNAVRELLLEKNREYGNSALEPLRIFSQADPVEQLKVRIDDKLSRIRAVGEQGEIKEDTVQDLIGYLVLLRVAGRMK